MFNDPLFILVVIACLIVLGVLGLGLSGFGKGSGWAHKNSNRLMRYRIGAQFVAVILIVIYVALRNTGG
ncbi:MAG: twin transmembrane helix small protein [Pseudomonadota bacterium]